MKNALQEIHNSINSMFDYNLETYKSYKANVERALTLIKSIQDQGNAMLTNWKTMGIEELEKELNGRLSEKFIDLSPEEQKSALKFSKNVCFSSAYEYYNESLKNKPRITQINTKKLPSNNKN